ncbi:MAG: NAD(P)H-dependent oxidoreductase [Betaproteobacteria bacterium]|nr:NAD(P)H-dependent oxidoreductase [Betaproteobacteria bacterium]
MSNYKIVGISGSLRQKSFNSAALAAAAEVMPSELSLEIVRYDEIPLYNQEIQDKGWPAAVSRLRDQIAGADGLLIASPEYNFSITGVLKNAIDWMSRVPDQPFRNKPIAIISATGGPLGGARNQYELRKILGCLEGLVLLRPEIYIGGSAAKFNAELKLTDEPTRKIMGEQMVAFRDWITRMKAGMPT